jgi:HSP20 family protein
VRFEVAGVRGEDLRVNLVGATLRLRGVRRVRDSGSIARLHQMEITFGPFEREVRLEGRFDPEGVRARLEDGLLEVRIPTRGDSRRTLTIERED